MFHLIRFLSFAIIIAPQDDCDITYMNDAVYSLTDSDKEFAESLRRPNGVSKENSLV